MQAVNNTFVDLINGNKQFTIPAFQRDYSWTTEQCDQMWDDIMRSGDSEEGDHFMGSIVSVSGATLSPAFGLWLVIDGQQRLTTLTILLIALRNHIRKISWSEPAPTPEQIDAYYLRNEHETGERGYRLALRGHDDPTLKALVDGKNLSEVQNSSELVVEAYHHFEALLDSKDVDPGRVYRGICQLKIVNVTLDRGIDNPQRVFESLNSTGVDLTQSDLIRNYLLMGLPEPEQTRMYEDYWSVVESLFREAGSTPDNFLRDYIALKQTTANQPRADRIYAEFKNFWQPSDMDSLAALLRDLVRFGRYFVAFLRPERIEAKSLSTEMRQVRSLGSGQAILVLRLYECYEDGTLEESQFARALRLVSSYLVRRSVLGLQTRGYWEAFARMAINISDESPFESFQVALARQSYRFPSDGEFTSDLQRRDLYGLRICWHILSQMENAGQTEPSPVGEYSIEHIMPQSIENVPEWKTMLGDEWEDVHQAWLHKLGNLTLTGYNSSYSNRPFEEKKTIPDGFEQSAVRLNLFVREQTKWRAGEMEKRGRVLAKRALEIWPHHDADHELILEEERRDLRARASRRSLESVTMISSVRDTLLEIRDAIRQLGDPIEIIEGRSLCYYDAQTASFFAETLPMSGYVRVLLPIDFEEAEDPEGVAQDVTNWKFLRNVTHRDCGVFVDVWDKESVPKAVAMVRQAFNLEAE